MKPLLLYCFLAYGLSGPALAQETGITPDPTPVKTMTVPYQIAVLDKITIIHTDGSKRTSTVAQDGTISDPKLQVKGLKPSELDHLLQLKFKGIAHAEVEEYRPAMVTVLGEVFHQIHTDMGDGPFRVLDAIAAANGFTPLANLRRVKLLRQNAGQVQIYELDLRQILKGEQSNTNILLKPGDVITVPRNFL